MQEFSVCSQVLPSDYAIQWSAYFMDQYSQLYTTVFDPIWHMEVCIPAKWVVQNNHMNVCNNDYFCPLRKYYWRKPLLTLPLVLKKELNHCIRSQSDWTSWFAEKWGCILHLDKLYTWCWYTHFSAWAKNCHIMWRLQNRYFVLLIPIIYGVPF